MDRSRDEDDPFLEQAREDVIGPFPARGLFDHHGDKGVHVEFCRIGHRLSLPWIPACAIRQGAEPIC